MCRCRINKALLSISVRLLCSFSVSSLTLRRSSSSAFRNSLSPTACSLRWLCSASSASSSLTRPRRAWHNRPLWRRTGERGKRSYVLWGCCSDKVRKKAAVFTSSLKDSSSSLRAWISLVSCSISRSLSLTSQIKMNLIWSYKIVVNISKTLAIWGTMAHVCPGLLEILGNICHLCCST